MIIGIAYYKKKDWKRFLDIADDREELEDTYEEWEDNINKLVNTLREKGRMPKKVVVDLDDLMNYCAANDKRSVSGTRSAYVAELTRLGKFEDFDI